MSHLSAIIEQRKQRWVDFYDANGSVRRLLLVRWMPDLPERPWPHLENTSARVEWAWAKYQLQLEQLDWLDDDTLPFLDVYTGTEIFAAAFGCKVYYPENDMPFAMPRIRSAGEVAGITIPDLDTPAIAALFAMGDALRRRAPEALMHLVDVQTPMDISALIWDKTTLYPAMIEEPEAVLELAGKVQAFQTAFLDEWFRRYGREFIAHYPDYYMPRGITLSVDEVGAVSSKMFQKYFTPELEAFSSHFGAVGVHCCANARHQWANFRAVPNLKLINLNQPAGILRDALPFFADTAAQWPIAQSDSSGAGPFGWMEPLGPNCRVVQEAYAGSKEEALAQVKDFRAASG